MAGAFAVGLFVAFLPIPFQMVVSAAIAILVRVNLPISVLLVWITNPLTMGPIFYASYRVGLRVLDMPKVGFRFDLSLSWFTQDMLPIWKPLLTGSLILGTLAALIGYITIRLLWRLHILRRISWKKRVRSRE